MNKTRNAIIAKHERNNLKLGYILKTSIEEEMNINQQHLITIDL
ncbi:MAG: hypothetical protein ACI9W7_000687 [Porticoccaceae bacterium]